MKQIAYALLLSTLLTTGSAVAGPGIFLESGGLVVMEVESIEAQEGWTYLDDIAGFTGNGYYEWTGPDHFSVGQAGNGTLEYTFTISTPGNYQLHWRSRISHGEISTEGNDSWVRFATGENVTGEEPLSGWTKVYMNQLRAWSWHTRTVDNVGAPLRQYFDAGDHTFEISGRSRGHTIDRIVLYKYDDISFDENTFTAFPESDNPTGTGNPNSPTDPEPDPDPDPEPGPDPDADPQPEYRIGNNEPSAHQCQNESVSLAPVNDIYVTNGIVSNTDQLRVDDANRKTLLKFDLSVIPAKTGAALSFSIGSDNGDGALLLSTGSHSDWSDTDASLPAGPDNSVLLGSYTGIWSADVRYSLPFDAAMLGSGNETIIVDMAAGGDDTALLSAENELGPRLKIEGDAGFCEQYDLLVSEAEAQAAAEAEAQALLEEQNQSNEPVDEENPDQGQASKDSGGGGSLDYLTAFMLLLVTLACRVSAGRVEQARVRRQQRQPQQSCTGYRR